MAKLKSKQFIENRDVYDITVENKHEFYANGVLVHNCGEIALNILGGFCVIADVVPFHAETLDEAEDAFRTVTRALIRINTMDTINRPEVERTNRIGVSITGIHEFAWKFFKYSFTDLIDEEKSKDFWITLSRFNKAVREEAKDYSEKLGLNIPHTMTTVKPAGCTGLSTKVRTPKGNSSLKEIFEANKINVFDSNIMKKGAWFKPITDILVYDIHNDIKKVTKLFCNGIVDVYEIKLEDGNIYKFTGNHKILTKTGGWVRIDNLSDMEDVARYAPFGEERTSMKVLYVKRLDQQLMTVDLEVKDTQSYQLDNGIVVHNTTSKLFGLTEGYHLPSLSWYLRWVQFRSDDPLVKEYKKNGYPHKDLKEYEGTTIIGFPTAPIIAEMGIPEDKFITAGEASMEDQYTWLKLGEKYWIHGVDENGDLIKEDIGNQISYTLKYKPDEIDFKSFKDMILKHQSNVKACSVMPQTNLTSYEYQPEQSITKVEYEEVRHSIKQAVVEDIGEEHVKCDTAGGCPIDFDISEKTKLGNN